MIFMHFLTKEAAFMLAAKTLTFSRNLEFATQRLKQMRKCLKNVWENAVKKEDPVEESLTWSDSHDESQLLDAKINWI